MGQTNLIKMTFTLLQPKRIPNFSQREEGIRQRLQAHRVQGVNHLRAMASAKPQEESRHTPQIPSFMAWTLAPPIRTGGPYQLIGSPKS
jgi:hypothetical protein